MNEQLQNRITYMIYCVNAFADRYRLTAKQAFVSADGQAGFCLLVSF